MTSSDITRFDPERAGTLGALAGAVLEAHPAGATDGSYAVACSRFNGGITLRLLQGALDCFAHFGVPRGRVEIMWVPGAFELPLAASRLARSRAYDAVVCLGAVIRGETAHFELVAGECARGIAQVTLDTGVPVVFGVLTTEDVPQALERCAPGEANKGYEAAMSALEMAGLMRIAPRPAAREPTGPVLEAGVASGLASRSGHDVPSGSRGGA